MDERIDAAKMMVDEIDQDLPGPVLIDSMDDFLAKKYGAQPERLYILKDGKIAYQGTEGVFNYSLTDAFKALKKLI